MSARRDLIAIVADRDQEIILNTLLTKRRPALGIRDVSFKILKHPNRDSGVFREAPTLLRQSVRQYSRALVLLDQAFHHPLATSAEAIRTDLKQRISIDGWDEPPEVFVISPETEAWVWTQSPALKDLLGVTWAAARTHGQQTGRWFTDAPKPSDPKGLFEDFIVQAKHRKPRPADFQILAERASVERCADPVFVSLRDLLRRWFPSQTAPGVPRSQLSD
ncbi:MAG: hypothetical protein IT450_14645 [Phycisphaerales bacterium]|nr:hypothetical protein [Phycisphaerales bacterium]